MQSSAYRWYLLAGIAITAFLWFRMGRKDKRLLWIYLGAIGGAFLGAKTAYLLAEGWMDLNRSDPLLRLLTGKSILGALLGGYAGVEIAKKHIAYTQITGDWFAFIAPIGIIIGRLGCLMHGCCPGVPAAIAPFAFNNASGEPRWPAVPMEILFNVIMLGTFAVLRKRAVAPTQHFHIYLIAYGVFRFGHEWLRDTPRYFGPFSGYHLAAVAVAVIGVLLFRRRSPSMVKDRGGLDATSRSAIQPPAGNGKLF